MKIEKRGKYAGVKVHLDPEECKLFIQLAHDANVSQDGMKFEVPTYGSSPSYFSLALKLGHKLDFLVQQEPDTMTERTPEQVKEVVEAEFITAQKKLAAIKGGKDWHGFTKASLK